jgi:hypothetical protein
LNGHPAHKQSPISKQTAKTPQQLKNPLGEGRRVEELLIHHYMIYDAKIDSLLNAMQSSFDILRFGDHI